MTKSGNAKYGKPFSAIHQMHLRIGYNSLFKSSDSLFVLGTTFAAKYDFVDQYDAATPQSILLILNLQ